MFLHAETFECGNCAATLEQIRGYDGMVTYHCSSCGTDFSLPLETRKNPVYWGRRNELVRRVERYLTDQVSLHQWNNLHKDISEFMENYQDANGDISLWVGLLACSTHGFLNINATKFAECRMLYNNAETIYKEYIRHPGKSEDVLMTAAGTLSFEDNTCINLKKSEISDFQSETLDEWHEIPDKWSIASSQTAIVPNQYDVKPNIYDIQKYQKYRTMYIKCWASYLIGTYAVKILFKAGKFFISKI